MSNLHSREESEKFLNQEEIKDELLFKKFVENIDEFKKLNLTIEELKVIESLARNDKNHNKEIINSIVQKSWEKIKIKYEELLKLEQRTKLVIAQLINKNFKFPEDYYEDEYIKLTVERLKENES